MVTIRFANTAEDLEAIYRFRYRIYVEEMRRPQKNADHLARRINDELDLNGHNIAAFDGTEIVGVVRANFARDGALGQYEEFYDLHSVGSDHPIRTSITTRLMVASAHRRSAVPTMLVVACYRLGLANDIRWNFIDCNDHLVRFFTRFGFVRHLPQGQHAEYGNVTRLRLDLRDAAHLAAVRSPFLHLLKASEQSSVTATARVARI